MLNTLLKLLGTLSNILLSNVVGIITSLNAAKGNISAKFLLRDIFSIFSKTGMILVFQVLTFLIFVKLPQGQDIIMVVVDEFKGEGFTGNVLGLLIGTFAWSLFSEFAVRYSIYVTDNSGNSLSEQRVVWRKAVQQAIADIFLLLPYLVVIASLWINYCRLSGFDQDAFERSFIELGGLLYALMALVSQVYFAGRNVQKKLAAKISGAAPQNNDLLSKLLDHINGWCYRVYTKYFPNADERAWLEKLQGIYNDYTFRIHKPGHFKGDMKKESMQLNENFLFLLPHERNRFPQNSKYMSDEGKVPEIFLLRAFSTDGLDLRNPDATPGIPAGYFRWQYHIPLKFYSRTHKWLSGFIVASLAWMVFILFYNSLNYREIGSPGLVLGAFCSWTGIYMAVLFIDFGFLRRGAPVEPGSPTDPPKYPQGWRGGRMIVDALKYNVSFRSLLLVWVLLASYYNYDHKVRYVNEGKLPGTEQFCDNRPPLKDHFRQWANAYTSDSSNLYFDKKKLEHFWPVVFVCAEGGAMRTGAFTSMMLGSLQDKLAVQDTGIDFRKCIYGCSGVSGGSLGLAAFNSLAYVDEKCWNKTTGRNTKIAGLQDASKQFFNKDYLSAVIGKLFYGDLIQLLWPWHVLSFDRSVALESSLSDGYEILTGENTFSKNFFQIYQSQHTLPALFINTTEVETGLQCWLTNVKPDKSMYANHGRDLFGSKLQNSLRLTTAVNFSTRFPIFCPAANVMLGAGLKRHYVDGGYVENTGAATMLEILQAIRPVADSFELANVRIRPYVLMLRFEVDDNKPQNISWCNEVTEVISGIYNTRAGRVSVAQDAICKYVEDTSLGGKIIQLQLEPDGKEVPMSWVFSTRSMNKLDQFVDTVWAKRFERNNDLRNLVFIDTVRFAKSR